MTLDEDDKKLLKNWIIGGAGLGGGAALIAALRRKLKRIQDEASTEDDDNVLYIKKKASSSTGLGLALAAGPLAGIGVYGLINALISAKEKKDAQEVLDKAQVAYINAKGYTPATRKPTKEEQEEMLQKQSSIGTPFHTGDLPIASVKAMALFAALASGAATWHILDANFPEKKPKVKAPRKVEIVEDEDDPRLPVKLEKKSSEKVTARVEDIGDFLIRMVGMSKQASDTKNVIAAIGNGDGAAFRQAVETVGYLSALNTVKNASANPVTDANKHIAVCCMAVDPLIKKGATIMAAVDFANQNPWFVKAASNLPARLRNQLVKFAAFFGKMCRQNTANELHIEKQASFSSIMQNMYKFSPADAAAEQVSSIIDNSMNFETGGTAESEDESGNVGDSHDDNNETSEENKKLPKFIYSTKNGIALAKAIQDMDALDAILSPKQGKQIESAKD